MRKMSEITPNENLKNLLTRKDFLKCFGKEPEAFLKHIEENLVLTQTKKSGLYVKSFDEFLEKS